MPAEKINKEVPSITQHEIPECETGPPTPPSPSPVTSTSPVTSATSATSPTSTAPTTPTTPTAPTTPTTPTTPEKPKELPQHQIPHPAIHKCKLTQFMHKVNRNHHHRTLKLTLPHIQKSTQDLADERSIYLSTPKIWIAELLPHSPTSEVAAILGRDLREAAWLVLGNDKERVRDVLGGYLRELGKLTVGKWERERRWPSWGGVWHELLRLMWYVIFQGEEEMEARLPKATTEVLGDGGEGIVWVTGDV